MTITQPYAFTGPYAKCYTHASSAIDERHVYILADILASWPFKAALELGCLYGASTTAFIEAINGGSEMVATFCDVDLTQSLVAVLGSCRFADRIAVTRDHSWDVLDSPEDFDFVLHDAGHDPKSISLELDLLVKRRPLCFMAHDTNASAAGYVACDGSELLKRTFEQMPDYQCIEDCQHRDGERTERGLFLATRDAELFALAQSIYERWGQ